MIPSKPWKQHPLLRFSSLVRAGALHGLGWAMAHPKKLKN